MNTTENLRFSVLCAPLARVDRRTLSQAWYSALYHDHSQARHAPLHGAAISAPCAASSASSMPMSQAAKPASVRRAQLPEPALPRLPAIDRRARQSPLARRIERRLCRKPLPSHTAATFRVGPKGRVRLLVRAAGSEVRLIAICAAEVRGQVGAALAQARYALAARGIRLDGRVQGDATP